MKYLVTGASGFIGSHVAKRLAETGCSVAAWGKQLMPPPPNVVLKPVDITDQALVFEEISRFKPDVIFHFAGQSFPKLSWEHPQKTLAANIIGTANILDTVAKTGFPCRLLIAGSSAQYRISSEALITEDHEQNPRDPYALSKFCADRLAVIYGEKYGLDIIRFLPFYVIGPGKKGDVASDFAHKVMHAHLHHLPSITVGNVDITRDFLDIEDGVSALLLLAEKGRKGEAYNICSGEGYKVAAMLEYYIALSGKPLLYTVDPSLVRKNEPPTIVGDPSKLMALGWKKHIAMYETLQRIYSAALP